MRHYLLLASLALGGLLTGCQLGRDSTLFVTKTSFGVDVDGKPATLDIGYDRKEGTVAPKFKDGNVIPKLASFQGRAGPISNALIGAAQSFALGEPAVIMARYMGNPNARPATTDIISDTELQNPHEIAGNLTSARRYFFGTDTNLGVKIGLAAEQGGMPESLSVGWKRKEIAYVPLETVTNGQDQVIVVPSLVATANFGVNPQSGSTNLNQFFATGLAANYLSAQPDIRAVLGARIIADDQMEARLKARQAVADTIAQGRVDGALLTTEAHALIDALDTDANVDSAHRAAIFARLLNPRDPFPHQQMDNGNRVWPDTLAGRKAYLKVVATTDDSDLTPYRTFVEQLKQIK